MTNSATTATYAYAASGFAGRSRHQVRTDVFTANVLCGRPADRVLTDREAEKLRDCFRCAKARAGADAQAMHDAAMAAAAQAEDVEAPAVDAPAAAADEPAATVLATLPGLIEVSVEDDRPNTMFVTRRGEALGTVLDEGDWSTTRGRYAARTTRGAARRDGVVGFYATRDDAVAAIIATNPHAAPTHGLTAPQRRAYEMLAAGDGWTTKDRGITRQAFTGLVNQGLAKFSNNSPAFWGGNLLTADPVCPPRLADPVQAFADAMAEVDAEVEQETTGALFPATSDALRRYTAADALLPVPPRTIPAEADRPAAIHTTLDDVDAGNRCVHGTYEEPADRTSPAAACARKGSGTLAGVFIDEGCVDTSDCAVLASIETRRLNADTGEDLHRWALVCDDHAEQPADTCEDCNTTDADEDAGADNENEEPMADTITATEQTTDRLYIEVETALAFPGYREDRYTLRSTGQAPAVQYVALPHDADIHRNVVFAALGLAPLEPLKYIAGPNLERGRVERIQPADFATAKELRAYLADEATARQTIGAHLRASVADLSPKDQVTATHALNPHVRPVLRSGDAYPLGWTFRVGSGDGATYAAVTRSGSLAGLTGYTDRETAEVALRNATRAQEAAPSGVTVRGSRPEHADHPDVRAALLALEGLPLAELTAAGHEDAAGYGWMIEPMGRGWVSVYWARDGKFTYGGRAQQELETVRARFKAVGWVVNDETESYVSVLDVAHRATDEERATLTRNALTALAALDAPAEPEAAAGPSVPAAAPTLTAEVARTAAQSLHGYAVRDFEPCEAPDGRLLGFTFKAGSRPSSRYGWVNPDGSCAPVLETYRSTIEGLLLKDAQTRPALPRRRKAPDAVQLEALRRLVTRLHTIATDGDMADVRRALAEHDEAMEAGR